MLRLDGIIRRLSAPSAFTPTPRIAIRDKLAQDEPAPQDRKKAALT